MQSRRRRNDMSATTRTFRPRPITTASAGLAASVLALALLLGACSADARDVGDAANPEGALAEPELQEQSASSTDVTAAGAAAEALTGEDAARTGKAVGSAAGQLQSVQVEGRAVISRVDLVGVTADPVVTAEQTRRIVAGAGGFISEESTVSAPALVAEEAAPLPTPDSTFLVARVPADILEETVDRIGDLGEVTSRSSNARDVTEQLVDLDSRVKSQRASINRMRVLLTEADDLGDVIAIESELSSREADLESLLARQAELGDLATLATVSVTWQTPAAVLDPAATGGFWAGLQAGWDAFVKAGTWLVTGLGAVLPFLLLGALVLLPVAASRRRRMRPASSALAASDVVDDAPQDVGVR